MRRNHLRVLQQQHLAVIAAGIIKNVRELPIIIVPAELHWATAEVLNTILVGPCVCGPVTALIIAFVDFLHVVEALSPELTAIGITLTRLLTPMGKNSSKLTLAHIIVRPAVEIVIVTEGWEFSYSLKEFLTTIKWVCMWEATFPVIFGEKSSYSLDIVMAHVIIEWAIV